MSFVYHFCDFPAGISQVNKVSCCYALFERVLPAFHFRYIIRRFYQEFLGDKTKKLFAGEQEKLLEAIIKEVEKEIENIKTQNEETIKEAPGKKEIRMLLVLDEITYAYSWNLIDRKKNCVNNTRFLFPAARMHSPTAAVVFPFPSPQYK